MLRFDAAALAYVLTAAVVCFCVAFTPQDAAATAAGLLLLLRCFHLNVK